MLANDTLIKEFSDRLTFHVMTTQALTKSNLNDQAVLSEGLAKGIASKLLDLKLESNGILKANADTIDLIDDNNRVCVQVTVRQDREKIDKTLENFIKKNII